MAEDQYEIWKEQGRPEGSYANWIATQQAPPTPPPAQPPPPPAAPAPQSGGGSPFSDPTATAEYNRMIAAGQDPTSAAGIVRNALFGVQHDWQAQGGDKGSLSGGTMGSGTYGALNAKTAADSVNQYQAWEKDRMSGCPPDFPYKGRNGQCAEKPDDCPDGMHVVGTPGKCVPNGPGEENLPQGPNSGGGGGSGSQAPAAPVTNGSQLSMTGNPMQDMLIQQFNSGQDPTTYQHNIFGLGEDASVGGTGRNADQGDTAPTRQGQSLGGGGLWWGQDKDTFSGFDASKKNAEGAATVSPAARTAVAPTVAAPVAAVSNPNGPSQIGGAYQANQARRKPVQTPLAGMVSDQFNSPARNRPSYF